jgi:PD-(D/E)XK endonuclease
VRLAQRKGDRATPQAIATLTALGFDVSIPLTESAAYDLVVDEGQALRRVQCKFASECEYLLRRCYAGRRSVSPDGA